jgi:hypothetical protein
VFPGDLTSTQISGAGAIGLFCSKFVRTLGSKPNRGRSHHLARAFRLGWRFAARVFGGRVRWRADKGCYRTRSVSTRLKRVLGNSWRVLRETISSPAINQCCSEWDLRALRAAYAKIISQWPLAERGERLKLGATWLSQEKQDAGSIVELTAVNSVRSGSRESCHFCRLIVAFRRKLL